MSEKQYVLTGIDRVVTLLRPNCHFFLDHGKLVWDDPRPFPTDEEILSTTEKLKRLEDELPIIFLDKETT